MNKLLIVDGSNLLFQMFFGMPSRIVNKDGKAIQGVLGFIGALLKIIRRTIPTHIVVLFDGEHTNERMLLNADYKGNRSDYSQMVDKETPFSQMPDVYRALDFLGVAHTETTDCEADDMIASYALTYGQKMQIVIVSFDSDFFQLITDNVSVLRYRGDKTIVCDPAYIQTKLHIMPSQYPDFKSLTGDTSDNIKGADKVGPITAAQLLAEFGTLSYIIQNAEYIKKPSIRQSIIQNIERLKINYQLIKLDNKTSLPFDLNNLVYQQNSVSTNEVLLGIGLI